MCNAQVTISNHIGLHIEQKYLLKSTLHKHIYHWKRHITTATEIEINNNKINEKKHKMYFCLRLRDKDFCTDRLKQQKC